MRIPYDTGNEMATLLNPPQWSCSWHWERTDCGNLTEAGSRKAYEDLEREISYTEKRLESLREMEEEILGIGLSAFPFERSD